MITHEVPRDVLIEDEVQTAVIEIAGQGTCEKTNRPAKVLVKHGHSVCWHVQNGSDQVCNVALRNFREVPGGQVRDVARGLHELQLRPGRMGVMGAVADKCGIERRVRYQYEVWLAIGPNPEPEDWHEANDPDYEIWP